MTPKDIRYMIELASRVQQLERENEMLGEAVAKLAKITAEKFEVVKEVLALQAETLDTLIRREERKTSSYLEPQKKEWGAN
jgi:hypothetical protein